MAIRNYNNFNMKYKFIFSILILFCYYPNKANAYIESILTGLLSGVLNSPHIKEGIGEILNDLFIIEILRRIKE